MRTVYANLTSKQKKTFFYVRKRRNKIWVTNFDSELVKQKENFYYNIKITLKNKYLNINKQAYTFSAPS